MPELFLPARQEPSDATGRPAFALPTILAGLLMAIVAVRWIYPSPAIQRTIPSPPPVLHRQHNHRPRAAEPVLHRQHNHRPRAAEPVLPAARHEPSDVTVRSALIAFPAILIGLFLAIMLVRWIYPGAAIDQRLPTALPVFPSPRLQANPQADMATFLQQELARLNSGGWDDEAKGLGHIPIDDAMRRIAASGIPDWPK